MIAPRVEVDEIRDPITIPAPPPSGSYIVGGGRLGRDEEELASSLRDTDPAPPPSDPDD
jgi:hypothetical protein